MRKFIILILGLSLIAASCDSGDIFNFGGGARGIFKSEDAGQTYKASDKISAKSDISGFSVNALVEDPSNADILYAGGNGIYKSQDGAGTWKYILSGITVASISIDQNSTSTLFASGIVGQTGKIIKSTDGGSSWTDIYSEPSKSNTVLSIAVSRSNSSVVLAGLNAGELIRSIDGGITWQAIKDFSDRIIQIKFGPSNTVYALTSTKGLFKSSDSGVTWTDITDSLTKQSLNQINSSVSAVTVFYDLGIDAKQSSVLYLATEQGLFRTVNDGSNWSFLALPLRNGALRVSAAAVDPSNSNNLFASVVSTVYKSANGGLTWETKVLPTPSTIHRILINPTSDNIIYLGLIGQ